MSPASYQTAPPRDQNDKFNRFTGTGQPETSTGDDCFSLYLAEHFFLYKTAKNHSCRRLYFAENLTVRATDFLPVFGVFHEHSRPYDVAGRSACFRQRMHDDFETSFGLQIRITWCHDFAIRPNRGRTCDKNVVTDAYGSGISNLRCPGRRSWHFDSVH
jgi:hypothetical protein